MNREYKYFKKPKATIANVENPSLLMVEEITLVPNVYRVEAIKEAYQHTEHFLEMAAVDISKMFLADMEIREHRDPYDSRKTTYQIELAIARDKDLYELDVCKKERKFYRDECTSQQKEIELNKKTIKSLDNKLYWAKHSNKGLFIFLLLSNLVWVLSMIY